MSDGHTSNGTPTDRVGTGIAGLDEVLGGGFPRYRLHLVQGAPGTGKTTLALQFLMEGAGRGESVLYVTLSETADEIGEIARSHGWNLDGITIRELAPTEDILRPEEQYTILHPTEVELGETIWAVLEEVEKTKPARVVFDSLAELRLLAQDPLRFRRQILGLKQFFAGRRCTVLLLDSLSENGGGLESVAHSVVHLEQIPLEYGSERRRVRVQKLRASRFRGGYHDYVIRTGGIFMYPRLIAAEHHEPFTLEPVPSGVPDLDRLLGGGLDRGTSALFIGPAGVGKSVLATQYAIASADRGEHAIVCLFDESIQAFVARAKGLGLALADHVEQGRIVVRQLDPAQVSPGEFDNLVRQAVEGEGARVVVIDSLNGYLNAMSEEKLVLVQLHELLTYLGQQGVLTLMTIAQHGLIGGVAESPLDVSYLADSVVLLRYFEAAGEIRQAISVVKKRSGRHERSIREFKLGPGMQVGQPVREFQGVLTGVPTYLGSERSLFGSGGLGEGGDG